MTYYSQENSSVEGITVSGWITLYPKIPTSLLWWHCHGGGTFAGATKEELAEAESRYEKHYDNLIVPLRKKYPNNKIIYCPYGLGVYELTDRLNQGNLPGIKHILSPDRNKNAKDQILRDPLGHGTDLVTVLNSLDLDADNL